MSYVLTENAISSMTRTLAEIKADPKVWGSDEPELKQTLYRLACLEEEIETLLIAIREDLTGHAEDCRTLVEAISKVQFSYRVKP